jgi:kynureninase
VCVFVLRILNEELQAWRTRGVEGHFTGERPWLTTDDYVRQQQRKQSKKYMIVGVQQQNYTLFIII